MRRVSVEEGGGRDLGRSSGVTPRVTHLGLGAAPGAGRLEPAAPPGESRPPRRVSIAVPTAPGRTLPQLRLRDVFSVESSARSSRGRSETALDGKLGVLIATSGELPFLPRSQPKPCCFEMGRVLPREAATPAGPRARRPGVVWAGAPQRPGALRAHPVRVSAAGAHVRGRRARFTGTVGRQPAPPPL